MARSPVARPGIPSSTEEMGGCLRAERERFGLSLRKLAARVGISPSALSQIETGRSRPSVSTLYAIVNELGISLDDVFAGQTAGPVDADPPTNGERPAESRHRRDRRPGIVQRLDDRKIIDMESGVRWERLNPSGDRELEFLEITYDVGAASGSGEAVSRHPGREYGVVIDGRLRVTVGLDEYELEPGDSICFDSTLPHRLEAVGERPARATWIVLGRNDVGPRRPFTQPR